MDIVSFFFFYLSQLYYLTSRRRRPWLESRRQCGGNRGGWGVIGGGCRINETSTTGRNCGDTLTARAGCKGGSRERFTAVRRYDGGRTYLQGPKLLHFTLKLSVLFSQKFEPSLQILELHLRLLQLAPTYTLQINQLNCNKNNKCGSGIQLLLLNIS